MVASHNINNCHLLGAYHLLALCRHYSSLQRQSKSSDMAKESWWKAPPPSAKLPACMACSHFWFFTIPQDRCGICVNEKEQAAGQYTKQDVIMLKHTCSKYCIFPGYKFTYINAQGKVWKNTPPTNNHAHQPLMGGQWMGGV